MDNYQQAFPAVLEIPSKDHPYGDILGHFRLVFGIDIAHRSFQGFRTQTCPKVVWRLTWTCVPYTV